MKFRTGFNILILLLISVSIAYINYFSDYLSSYESLLTKFLNSVIIILIFYVIQNIIEEVINSKINAVKERYHFRKTILTIISILIVVSLIAVWFKETTSLILAYGLLSAGIAIALQDLLKSIAGGIMLLISRPFVAGDRIQVERVPCSFIEYWGATDYHGTNESTREQHPNCPFVRRITENGLVCR